MLAAENQPIEVSRCGLEQALHHLGGHEPSKSNPGQITADFGCNLLQHFLAYVHPIHSWVQSLTSGRGG